MKNHFTRLALFMPLAFAAQIASAGCVALDYQEMKDMKADELVAAWCDARQAVDRNMADMIDAIGRKNSTSDEIARRNEVDQCLGQAKRIERALETKGVPQKTLQEKCAATTK